MSEDTSGAVEQINGLGGWGVNVRRVLLDGVASLFESWKHEEILGGRRVAVHDSRRVAGATS